MEIAIRNARGETLACAEMESAARLYCESIGVDPDELVTIGSGTMRVRWAVIAHELQDLHKRLWALRRCGFTVS